MMIDALKHALAKIFTRSAISSDELAAIERDAELTEWIESRFTIDR